MILEIKIKTHNQGRVIRFTPGYYNLIPTTPEVLVTPRSTTNVLRLSHTRQ